MHSHTAAAATHLVLLCVLYTKNINDDNELPPLPAGYFAALRVVEFGEQQLL